MSSVADVVYIVMLSRRRLIEVIKDDSFLSKCSVQSALKML